MIEGILLFFSTIMFRPMVLGYSIPIAGVGLGALTIFMATVRGFSSLKCQKEMIYIFVSAIIFSLFTVITLSVVNGLYVGLNTVVMLLISNAAMLLALGSGNPYALRAIRILFTLIVISGLITAIISRLDLDRLQSLAYLSFPIRDRVNRDSIELLFPFSTAPYWMTLQNFILPRFTFFAIEPGVAVFVIILWRYLYIDVIKKKYSIMLDVIFLTALALTASTTAPIIATFWFAFRAVYNRNEKIKAINFIIAVMVSVAGFFVLLYLPFFGVLEKLETHGRSFEDRLDWYGEGGNIARMVLVFLSLVWLMFVRRYLPRRADSVLASAAVVSILNVLAFSPIFFLSVYLIKSDKLSRLKAL